MKKFGILIYMLVVGLVSFGESPLNLGLKFGTNSSKLVTNFDDILNQNVQETKINNYLAGIFGRVSIGKLYFQPEAYFNTKGGVFTTPSSPTDLQGTSNQINFQTVDVPILIGIKFVNKPQFNCRVHAGPLFSFLTSTSISSGIANLAYENFDSNYVGWQAGLGIDFWFVTVDARMENSVNILNSTTSYSAYSKSYLLSIGIKLF